MRIKQKYRGSKTTAMNRLINRLFFSVLIISSLGACKELEPILDKVKPLIEQQTQGSDQFSSGQIGEAIKQALAQGVGDSVDLLSRVNGFSLSDVYRIPLPQQLDKAADVLRKFGQGRQVDEFEQRLNLAAEQSVEKAVPVFTSAITAMTLDDAISIMKGTDNAATAYFKDKTDAILRSKFRPIIKAATDKTGLTSSYKSLTSKISTLAPAYSTQLVDIDDYVLNHAMDALFDRIAIEEKLIREQPAKRSTDLMKSVYGYFAR